MIGTEDFSENCMRGQAIENKSITGFLRAHKDCQLRLIRTYKKVISFAGVPVNRSSSAQAQVSLWPHRRAPPLSSASGPSNWTPPTGYCARPESPSNSTRSHSAYSFCLRIGLDKLLTARKFKRRSGE